MSAALPLARRFSRALDVLRLAEACSMRLEIDADEEGRPHV